MVSSTPRPHFTPGKNPLPILQEAGWAPGLVWTGVKSRPNRDSIPDRPAHSQSLYREGTKIIFMFVNNNQLRFYFCRPKVCSVLFTLDERWCCFLPTSGLGMVHSVPHTSCLPTIYPEIISSPTTIVRQLITFVAAYKSSNIARIGSGSMCLHGTLYAYLFRSMFYYCYY